MVSRRSLLIQKLQLEFNNISFEHHRCAAHVINLVVIRGVEVASNTLHKLCKFVKKVKNSSRLLNELRDICSVKKQPYLVPILDNEIRWGSMYEMIERQIKIKEMVQLLVNNNLLKLEDLYFNLNEWKEINLKKYLDVNSSEYPIASAIYNKLKEYWNHYFDIHSAIPVVLDPQSKLTNFLLD
ncbi:19578_t:CDS:2 [Racocetra fulgida]|uniref:19578_t:CDS:1 n=1 Tax=Racocetra fulgida TaxID=60492 RepID=A0A9N9B2M0_9GLOM|nr:19578_t:CDS:2 [Racocetra fulgida]